MTRQYSSTAIATTITSGISDSDVTLPVASTSGFPIAFPYTLAIDPENGSKELVEVTAAAGLNLTVTRGVDGTSAVSHSLSAVVEHVHSARDFREAQEHIAADSDVHGVTGDLVGATSTQTLTNKDLSSGTNTFPTSLATVNGVQALTNKDLTSGTNTFPTSLATLTGSQTLTNKDLTSGTNTFPTSLVTLTGSQTLTNKTLTDPTINGTVGGTPTFGAIAATSLAASGAVTADSATVAGALSAGSFNLTPAGTVLYGVWTSAPAGFLLCDGTAVSRTTYATLFALVGTTYGTGDGTTTFNLPNLIDKFVRGSATDGSTGGSDTHTHVLSSSGWAKIAIDTSLNRIYSFNVTADSWNGNKRVTALTTDTTAATSTAGAALGGDTGTGSTLPAYVTLVPVIKT